MQKRIIVFIFQIIFIVGIVFIIQSEEKDSHYKPVDWFYQQRAYPTGELNREAYREAIQQSQMMRKKIGGALANGNLQGL